MAAVSEEVASFWRSVGMSVPATVPPPLVLPAPPPPPLPVLSLPTTVMLRERGAANALDAVAAAAAVVEKAGGITTAAVGLGKRAKVLKSSYKQKIEE
eukprot:gene13394-14768_t